MSDASSFTDVRRVAETGSTNADLLALAREGAPEGVVLVADHQTAGRGRLGRSWEAPPGASLLVSVLLRPPAPVVDLVTMVAALAMADSVAEVANVDARLKWPNDLVADGRKLAGLLAEAEWIDGTPAVVVGVGVNVNWPATLPSELAGIAVACNHVAGQEVDREGVLQCFLERLGQRYRRLLDDGDRGTLLDEWRARSATLGQHVRVELGRGQVVGTAVDVDERGHLVVELDDGARRSFAAGDVVHVRPA